MIYLGDCLEVMKSIPDKSIDCILTDPPYGATACKWDSVIPFEPMWNEIKRVRKDNAAICLFGNEPFSSALRMSNIKEFKYDWIWSKNKSTGYLNANRIPLRAHELILIFGSTRYFPVMGVGKPYSKRHKPNDSGECYGAVLHSERKNVSTRFPRSIIEFNVEMKAIHPTQKPVDLLGYLIKTYTLEDETVLDFTMGSGSTGVAAMNTGRKFIGIEKDAEYFAIAKQRIENAESNLTEQLRLTGE